jgi:predicted transcriptional regulator
MNARQKRQIKALYHLSPVLWAIVQGCTTRLRVEDKLGKDCSSALQSAHAAYLVKEEHGRLVLTNEHHRSLARAVNSEAYEANDEHPLLSLLADGPSDTVELARVAGRPYNSVYKTLRRLEEHGLVQHLGKHWVKV